MKAFVILFAFVALASADDECYTQVVSTCNEVSKKLKHNLTELPIKQCDAKYGAIDSIQSDLQVFTNRLLHNSFDFLLMATHYGNYIKNRPGFEKLFRGLSDNLWEDGIETIKYITSRGGQMNFANIGDLNMNDQYLELYELQSLGKALDIEKRLAKEAFKLHRDASGHKEGRHDPEIAHHLEEKFMEKHRDTIRELAGHAKDLSGILDGPDASLGLYLFDEYLQK